MVESRNARGTAVALKHAVMMQEAKEAPPFLVRDVTIGAGDHGTGRCYSLNSCLAWPDDDSGVRRE
jgi:ABC-type hemin transport system ATPase subunit